jgi:hypothetical protein
MSAVIVDSFQTQKSRIALENVYGQLADSPNWNQLGDIRLIPKPVYEQEAFAGAGDILPSGMQLIDAFSNVDITGQASFNGIMFPFTSIYGFPTTTTPGGATLAREHLWSWNGADEIFPPSFTLDYGIPGRARRIAGMIFNTLGLTFSRSGVDFSASGFGKKPQLGVTMGGTTNEVQTITLTDATGGTFTASYLGYTTGPITYNAALSVVRAALEALPTIGAGNVVVTGTPGTEYVIEFTARLGGRNVATIAVDGAELTGSSPSIGVTPTTPGADTANLLGNVPISPLRINVYVDNAWADLGETQWRSAYSAGFEMGDRFARAMTLTSDQSGDTVYNAEEQEHTVSLRLGADAAADSLFADVENGVMKFVRLEAFGGQIESGQQYYWRKDMALLLQETDGYDSENGIHVVSWTARLARDPETGNAVEVMLRNRVAGI